MFVYRRRVAFGDCDPARIYFAPRAIEYAVEAVEAWFADALGVTWADFVKEHHLGVTTGCVDCAYSRSLVADQVVQVRVGVVEIERSTVTFSAVGEGASGEAYFWARLVTSFVDLEQGIPVSIPSPCRRQIKALQSEGAGKQAIPTANGRSGSGTGFSDRNDSNPLAVPTVPFTSQHRVVYGDCTVSGTIYVPKMFSHAVEAVGQWYRDTLKVSWLEQCVRKRGTPFLRIMGECRRPLVPGRVVTFSVRVPRLGRSSIDYAVTGYDDEGGVCFHSLMSACYISDASGIPRSIPFPDEMRGRIEAYQAACEDLHASAYDTNPLQIR